MSHCHLSLLQHASPVIVETGPGLFVVKNYGEGEYGFFEGRPLVHQNADGTRVPYIIHPHPSEILDLSMRSFGGCK